MVLLSGGDVVPADLRLIRVDRLQLDRSVLTGESIPEQGRTEPDAGDSDLADRRSIAYGGTSVVGGRGGDRGRNRPGDRARPDLGWS